MKLHSETYDSYKNAEGEWSESIPSGWEEKRVKDLFRLVTDAAPADNDYELLSLYAGIGVKPRKDLEARGNKASSTDGYWIVKKNDIVVNKLLAWMGSVGLSEYNGVTSPAYDVLRQVNRDIDPRYFAYLFRTEIAKKIFRKNSRGIMDMRLRLYFDKLGAITVPVPSASQQVDISNYIEGKISTIDQKISKLTFLRDKYLKLRGAVIDKASILGIHETSDFDVSDIDNIAKIPKGWRTKRLKEVGYLYSGLTGKKGDDFSEDFDDSMPYIPFTNIANNFFLSLSQVKSVRIGHHEKQNVIKEGDLFFLMSSEDFDDLGKCSVLTDVPTNKTFLNSFCKGFRVTSKEISPVYLAYLLHSSPYRVNLSNEGKGFTRINLKIEKVNDTKVLIPPKDVQSSIILYLNKKTSLIDRKVEAIEKLITKQREMKIAIVYDAVTGKINTSEIVSKRGCTS
ncbi:restriction endonuclease subunit S [Vibrio sp. nBUS_14]|uniref:restriction endonuclease subunit S n=1 Tax=Vibrio sp. nBUS_14 TaxID=3395321 RepID=UPI003EBDFDC7